MAKRVNTQFVLILGCSLTLVGMAGAGLVWMRHRRAVDPAILKAEGQTAERNKDLPKAITAYGRAGDETARRHMPGADQLYAQAADLATTVSMQATDNETGVRYYQIATDLLQRALNENPSNRVVADKVIRSQYDFARYYSGADGWSKLEDLINHYLSPSTPDAALYALRAEARLRWAQCLTIRDIPETRFTIIEDDLKQSLKLDPESANTVALYGELLAIRTQRARFQTSLGDSKQIRESQQKMLRDYLAKHADEPRPVAVLAASLRDENKYAEAIPLVKKAYEAHPGNAELGEMLADLYGVNSPPVVTAQPDLIEKILKELLATHATEAEFYVRLASFYQARRQLSDAVNTYKDVLDHAKGSGGLNALKNENFQLAALDSLAWIYMDLAEGDKVESDQGKKDLTEASSFIEKLRAQHAMGISANIDVLDGRMQFLRYNLPSAETILRRAEATLPHVGQMDRLRQTKILLARIYLIQSPPQFGAALDLFDQALALQPDSPNPGIMVERASVLLQLSRFVDAQNSMEGLLKYAAVLPQELVDRAKQVQAAAKSGLGQTGGAQELLTGIGTPAAMIQLAQTQLAASEPAAALVVLQRALAKEPDNLTALRLAVVANLRLDHKDDALKALDVALAKYPDNSSFQAFRASLNNSTSDPVEAQKQIIASITDVYARQLQMAALYRSQQKSDDEIKALEDAKAAIPDVSSIEGKQKLGDVIDRLFLATVAAAKSATTDADKSRFWKMAEVNVSAAERFNNGAGIDGTGGKLYRGRLLLNQSPHDASGLKLLEQAVLQRPDYAAAHKMLGQAYVFLGRNDAALEEFRQALHLVPNDIPLICATLDLLIYKPDTASRQEVRNLLTQGFMVSPNDPRLAEFNDVLAKTPEEISTAIKTRENILKRQPNDARNARRLALLYVAGAKKDPEALNKAVEIVRPLLARDKNDFESLALLASLYNQQGKVDEGIKLFEPYAGDTDEKVRYVALILMGEFCKTVQRVDQAVATFTEAQKYEPKGSDDAERHLGDLYFENSDMVKAESTYQDIVNRAPADSPPPLVLKRLIETQIRAGKFDAAEQLLKKQVFAKNPDDLQGLVLEAFALLQQQQFPAALKDLDKVLAANPGYPDALYYRALTQFSMGGNLQQAINDLLLIRNGDRGIKARVLLTQVYRQSQRYVEAVNEYGELLKLQPDFFSVRRDFAAFLMNLCEVYQHLPRGSSDDFATDIRRINPIDALQSVISDSQKLYPNQPGWFLLQGDLFALQGQNDKAQQYYAFIFQKFPEEPVAVNSYLGSLMQTKNYEEVVKIATAMIPKRPEVLDFVLRRGAAFARLKKTDEAIADVDLALTLCADLARQSHNYTPFFSAMEQISPVGSDKEGIVPVDALIARLRVRLGASPDELVSSIGLMQLLIFQGNSAEAMKIAAGLHIPPDDRVVRFLVLKATAMAHFRSKEYAAAAQDYNDALALAPNDIESLNNYAFLLADNMNRPADALPFVERALKALRAADSPSVILANASNLYDTYGWVKSLAGDTNGAVEALRRSLSAQPTPAAYLHLAQTFRKAHRLSDADDTLDRGIQLATTMKDDTLAQMEALRKEMRPNAPK